MPEMTAPLVSAPTASCLSVMTGWVGPPFEMANVNWLVEAFDLLAAPIINWMVAVEDL